MARDRALSASQPGCHELRVQGLAGVADGVDAGVDAVQMTLSDAPAYRGVVQSAGHELVEADPTVLSRRDRGDAEVGG